ncbi:MAG: efflux RND transporter periplasmic adaptor subunit [Hyphomicrobiaceae bacterium]
MQKKTIDDLTEPPAGSTKAAQAPAKSQFRVRMPQRRFLMMLAVMLLGPLLAAAVGTYIYMLGGRYVSTDNAYVKADKIAVSADVDGRVAKVMVKADEDVKRGQLMFVLDQEPFRIALDKAEAKLASTTQEVDSIKAIYDQKTALLKQAQGDLDYFEQNYNRQKALTDRGVTSRSLMDTAEKNLRFARGHVAVVRQQMAEIRARLGGDPERPTNDHPTVREARAARAQAALDLRHTEIRAPVAGIITNFDLQPGEYVEKGSVVFSMVGSEETWIQANFKETDLGNVKPGQKATIHVDTYPDLTWTGIVTSISPATGAEFALLPPQNATGNWVKVVQRLAVRLRIDPQSGADAKRLRAGMSVEVDIDTQHKRNLPNWVSNLFGIARAEP